MKILYLHGFKGDGLSPDKAAVLKQSLKAEILSPVLANEDFEADFRTVTAIAHSEYPDAIIGTSFGAFLALITDTVTSRIVHNPCLRPSVEIPKLYPGVDAAALRRLEKLLPAGDLGMVTGFFAPGDELFSYKDEFEKMFGKKGKPVPGGTSSRLKSSETTSSRRYRLI